jgi:hypothetical protein
MSNNNIYITFGFDALNDKGKKTVKYSLVAYKNIGSDELKRRIAKKLNTTINNFTVEEVNDDFFEGVNLATDSHTYLIKPVNCIAVHFHNHKGIYTFFVNSTDKTYALRDKVEAILSYKNVTLYFKKKGKDNKYGIGRLSFGTLADKGIVNNTYFTPYEY